MVNKLSCLYKGHEGIKFFLFFILEIRSDPDVPWQRGEVFVSSCKGVLYSNKINKCKHQKATSETGTEKAERPQSTYWCIWFLKNCNYEFLLYNKIGNS